MTTTPITGETWGDEIETVRGFLLSQSERPFAELRPEVEVARQDIIAAIVGLSEEQAAFRPAGGEGEDAMGIAEVMRHVISIETIFAERIRQLGLGREVNVTRTYPGYREEVDTQDIDESAARFATTGALMMRAVEEIEGRERLDTFDSHRLFGPLNCRGWFALHAVHLRDHVHQIGKIKAMEGYPPA
jgi:hypothetical protein